ncbi:hypothetical protein BBP00_00007040 [Phytophthora kernoviae]|uniref:Thioredoxin domain-containing protein n=1 Tax=Phytophthora kernoviae TaxID=325452 RepID=A0A3F2RJY9_9STRA|nr:hypothetical protein BBP00_00007040 [Phytophthora kernoviae]
MASSSSFNAALAVLLAAKYCRQYPLFHWREEALPSMGRRAEKYCFRVDMLNLQQENCGEMLLSLLPAQLSLLDFQKNNTLYKLKALLVTLKHPYILPVLDIYYSREKKALVVVQPFVASGSLKDRIYRVDNPAKLYDVKYRLENAQPLLFEEIAKFSRQIVEALAGLRSKGLVCDHLRSTNVVIDAGKAKIAEIYTPLLALDRYKDSRELTVGLERYMDIDLLLFGQILYEMATGMELLTPEPDESVLDMLAPEIAEVLLAIFYYPDTLVSSQSPTPPSSSTEDVESNGADFDGAESTSSAVSSHNKKHLFLVDLERMLEELPLFAVATDVPPIDTLFSGFRLDSSMKSTIKHSMRINASRNQAHIVHYNDQEALLRARQRAERRVYEEKEKQQQRIQQLTASKNPTSKGNPTQRSYMSCALNELAPDMTLVDLETGDRINLTELVERTAKPTVLMFYATWSKACEPEVELIEAFSKGGHHKLINFVLVNLDQNIGETMTYLDTVNPNTGRPRVCRNYWDGDIPTVMHFGCAEVPEPYGLQSVPHRFVLDENGILRRNGDDFDWGDIAGLLLHLQEPKNKNALSKLASFFFPVVST